MDRHNNNIQYMGKLVKYKGLWEKLYKPSS